MAYIGLCIMPILCTACAILVIFMLYGAAVSAICQVCFASCTIFLCL